MDYEWKYIIYVLGYIFIKKTLEGQKETTEIGYLQRAAVSTNKTGGGRGRSKISLNNFRVLTAERHNYIIYSKFKTKINVYLKQICIY